MKITVIGGGSTYTPEIVMGLLERVSTLPLSELCLMDIDPDRLAVVGGFACRIVRAHGDPFTVHLTGDLRSAIEDAAYVVTQFRVGQMAARKADEYLGLRHGLIGQETTGIGGMAKALRTIPVMMEIAGLIRELTPGGVVINFTNPSGLVTEALTRYAPDVPSIGLCNAAITTHMHMVDDLVTQGLIPGPREQVDSQDACLDVLGLNHLTWYRGFRYQGQDLWPQVFENARQRQDAWYRELLPLLEMIPNNYLQYYYDTTGRLASQQKWPPSRAEQVIEIEHGLLNSYADRNRTEPPEDLMKRGGSYYSTLATRVINAHYNDLNEVQVVNTRHNGSVPGWPIDWVLELPCQIGRQGATPLPAQPLPPVCFGLLAQVKMYELLTVEAAMTGDRQKAAQALLVHPLGPGANQVAVVLADLLLTNHDYLPRFFTE